MKISVMGRFANLGMQKAFPQTLMKDKRGPGCACHLSTRLAWKSCFASTPLPSVQICETGDKECDSSSSMCARMSHRVTLVRRRPDFSQQTLLVYRTLCVRGKERAREREKWHVTSTFPPDFLFPTKLTITHTHTCLFSVFSTLGDEALLIEYL